MHLVSFWSIPTQPRRNPDFQNSQFSLWNPLPAQEKKRFCTKIPIFVQEYEMSPYVTEMHFLHVWTCQGLPPTILVEFRVRNPTNPKCSILTIWRSNASFEVHRPQNANSTRENSPLSCHSVRCDSCHFRESCHFCESHRIRWHESHRIFWHESHRILWHESHHAGWRCVSNSVHFWTKTICLKQLKST